MYVDGFVVPVPKNKLADYKRLATKASKVWKKYGALEYIECVGDDIPEGKVTSFTKSVKAKKGEVVVFAWIVYKSRAHRDQVNKKVMNDPLMKYHPDKLPFDGLRMFWGGFKGLVAA
jgi:uncharacterized protein YbaA (DUF1428 family)